MASSLFWHWIYNASELMHKPLRCQKLVDRPAARQASKIIPRYGLVTYYGRGFDILACNSLIRPCMNSPTFRGEYD